MTGPTVGVPTLAELVPAVAAGDYDNGDVVYVHDIEEFVRVYQTDLNEPVVIRNRYPSVPDYEGDVEEEYIPPWTPGVVVAEGIPYTPVVESECIGAALPLGVVYGRINAPSSAMPVQLAAAASDPDITTDLSVPTSTDPP